MILINNFLIKQSIKLSIISLLIFGFIIHYQILNNLLFTISFFITSSIFSILLLLKFSYEKKNISIINFFIFFIIFYNLYFYFFYLLLNITFDFSFYEPSSEYNPRTLWEKLTYNFVDLKSGLPDRYCFSNNSCYFSFINNIDTINLLFYLNFIFYFFVIVLINIFSKSSQRFNFEKIEDYYSLKSIFFVFSLLFLFDYMNNIFLESKILNFIFSDSIKLLLIFFPLYLFSKVQINSKNKFFVFIFLLILYFLISTIYEIITYTGVRQIYWSHLDPYVIHWSGNYINRAMIYSGFVVYTFFFILSKYYNYKFQYKLFLIVILICVFLPTVIYYNFSLFNIISEIQINRNVSIVIEGIDRNYFGYEKLEYLEKLFKDIFPFTGRERGYSSLMVQFYDKFDFGKGISNYNFGVIAESYLFLGVLGAVIVAILFSFIIITINFLFSFLKKDLFLIFCYCHLFSQVYWLYRGGMALFIRKIYFFSAIYLILFIMLFLAQSFFQKKYK